MGPLKAWSLEEACSLSGGHVGKFKDPDPAEGLGVCSGLGFVSGLGFGV